MKWEHVTTAPNRIVADMWCDILDSEGIPSRADIGQGSFLGAGFDYAPCRIIVPAELTNKAIEVLAEIDDNDSLIDIQSG